MRCRRTCPRSGDASWRYGGVPRTPISVVRVDAVFLLISRSASSLRLGTNHAQLGEAPHGWRLTVFTWPRAMR
eukprot:scaffold104367_cov28-Tisochrysis_lutea.AAC.6